MGSGSPGGCGIVEGAAGLVGLIVVGAAGLVVDLFVVGAAGLVDLFVVGAAGLVEDDAAAGWAMSLVG